MCFLWEKQIFTKLNPIILCTASLEFSFSVKCTVNNAEIAAFFSVSFKFLTSICHIYFYPLKLTETCLSALCWCISLCTQLCCVNEIPQCYKSSSSTHNSTFWMGFFGCGTCTNFLFISNVNIIIFFTDRMTHSKKQKTNPGICWYDGMMPGISVRTLSHSITTFYKTSAFCFVKGEEERS